MLAGELVGDLEVAAGVRDGAVAAHTARDAMEEQLIQLRGEWSEGADVRQVLLVAREWRLTAEPGVRLATIDLLDPGHMGQPGRRDRATPSLRTTASGANRPARNQCDRRGARARQSGCVDGRQTSRGWLTAIATSDARCDSRAQRSPPRGATTHRRSATASTCCCSAQPYQRRGQMHSGRREQVRRHEGQRKRGTETGLSWPSALRSALRS